jgi:hypothetical protein
MVQKERSRSTGDPRRHQPDEALSEEKHDTTRPDQGRIAPVKKSERITTPAEVSANKGEDFQHISLHALRLKRNVNTN